MIIYVNNYGYYYILIKVIMLYFSRGIFNRYNVSKFISGFGMVS